MRSVGGMVGCTETDFEMDPLAVSVGGMMNRGRYVRAWVDSNEVVDQPLGHNIGRAHLKTHGCAELCQTLPYAQPDQTVIGSSHGYTCLYRFGSRSKHSEDIFDFGSRNETKEGRFEFGLSGKERVNEWEERGWWKRGYTRERLFMSDLIETKSRRHNSPSNTPRSSTLFDPAPSAASSGPFLILLIWRREVPKSSPPRSFCT
jgi:hypothetical protein